MRKPNVHGKGDSPQYALDRLDPRRIAFARERLGLTGKELAEKIGKTPSAVSQFEHGVTKPDLDTFVRLSMALKVPTSFFIERESSVPRISLDACHFRSKRSVTQRDRRRSARLGELLVALATSLERKGVVFPEDEVTNHATSADSMEEVEIAASELRSKWGMGVGPIPNMVQLLESKGVFVLPIYDACEEVDAYATHYIDRPCVMLAFNKTASRARFDAAHELGHLILHDDVEPGYGEAERQADRFAAAFLAPREGFLQECPRRWSLAAFKRLKFRWKMSIAALVRRAYDLDKISRSSYTRAFKELSRKGMRKDEGEEWPMERPTLISQTIELLADRVSLEGLADEIDVYPAELEELLQMCVPRDLMEKLRSPHSGKAPRIVELRRDN